MTFRSLYRLERDGLLSKADPWHEDAAFDGRYELPPITRTS